MISDKRPAGGSPVAPPHEGACPLVLIIPRPPAALRSESAHSLLRTPAAGFTLEDRLDYDALSISGETGTASEDCDCFEGRELDADRALQYNRCRHSDPTPARWLSDEAPGLEAGRCGATTDLAP